MSQVIVAPIWRRRNLCDGSRAIRRREELFAILGDVFAQQPWSHWQSRMRAAGVPAGR